MSIGNVDNDRDGLVTIFLDIGPVPVLPSSRINSSSSYNSAPRHSGHLDRDLFP
jgi:hypothetical protein